MWNPLLTDGRMGYSCRLLVFFVLALLTETGCGSSSSANDPPFRGTVNATAHPLVAEYQLSVPPPGQVSVDFGPDLNYGRRTWSQHVPAGGDTVSLLVAGMRANTTYHMRARIDLSSGITLFDADHTFTTGALPQASFPAVTVTPSDRLMTGTGVELLSSFGTDVSAVVLDTDGTVIWYYYDPNQPASAFPIRRLANGNYLINFGSDMREVDLAGHILREMTLDQLNTALAAGGYSLQAAGIHHDVLGLNNQHWIFLVYEYRDFQDLPGYPGTTSVLGDALVDLDPNNEPVWVWQAFDHLDVHRHPFMFPDWTHSNAIVYTSDGNLLLSMRHQSWILKIAYANGTGSGDILWRLGPDSDFTLSGGDPAQWFYNQHFPVLLQTQGAQFRLALYDNGDTRPDSSGQPCIQDNTCYSRAVIMNVDQLARTADVSWEYVPGWFSFWGGSIRVLSNGNVECDSSTVDGGYSRVIEVMGGSDPQLVWQMDTSDAFLYRAYRISSLYPGVQW
jgi:arylsulfate sulfotransferase